MKSKDLKHQEIIRQNIFIIWSRVNYFKQDLKAMLGKYINK